MAIEAKDQWKRKVGRALKRPANLISGSLAVAASAALWNPLPLILWGLGAGAYALFGSGEGLERAAREEERKQAIARAVAERKALREALDTSLSMPPIIDWIRSREMPDYREIYRRLEASREKVSRVLAARKDEALGGLEILDQLDYLLGAYLSFVRERIVYLGILSHFGVDETPPPPPPVPTRVKTGGRGLSVVPSRPASRLPTIEGRLEEIAEKIALLRQKAQEEPATARTREWHMGILEKQRELLVECQKRDQYVEAQLAAFPDVFDVIVGRVGASQFSATEMASYMGAVVEQVEESERFVASLKPAMDELVGGLDPAAQGALSSIGSR
ncbi:MAG TPA: hypothetical protein VF017_12875 [Thermoanaerobaculia bacterium]|nr:hypothetical protein [Thermoanaerobaculia bacterium]